MVASDNVTAASGALARGEAQSDEAGKAAGLSGAVADATQPKVHEEALRRPEASLREALAEEQTIFDTAMVGIAIMRDRVIQRCNRRYAEMFGYTEDELIGKSSRIFFPTEEDFAGLGVRARRAPSGFRGSHTQPILLPHH